MISLYAVKNSSELSDDIYVSLFNLASPDRKQRLVRFLRKEDACRCSIGEALARYCISKRKKVFPHSIVFKLDDFGKPFIIAPGKTQFNISHSNSWVVCAIGDGPIGVDIEHIHDIDLSVAERFFHPDEYAEITILPHDLQKSRFFELWTLKESYIKAIGKGLSCQLDGFAMHFEADKIAMRSEKNWPIMFFKQYDLGIDYKCALCAAHNDFPKQIETMTPKELLYAIRAIGIV